MQLDELKHSMSLLDQILAKTSVDVQINVSAAQTAQSKMLKNFRQGFTTCLVLAVVFAAAIAGGINPLSFPVGLKVYLVAYLLLAAIWYVFLYRRLKSIDIAALAPAKLISITSTLKLLALSGEVFFGIGIAVLFALLIPDIWAFNRIGFWAVIVALVFAIIYSIVHLWPQYIKLFRDLNTLK